MRLYLDVCAWKRPYDRQDSERVTLEALAVAALLRAVESGQVIVVSSAALEAENRQNPDARRRTEVAALLARLEERIPVTESVADRARELVGRGLTALDALHVASAEQGGCDYLVTTDDRMLKALRRDAQDLRVVAIDPLGLVRMLEGFDP